MTKKAYIVKHPSFDYNDEYNFFDGHYDGKCFFSREAADKECHQQKLEWIQENFYPQSTDYKWATDGLVLPIIEYDDNYLNIEANEWDDNFQFLFNIKDIFNNNRRDIDLLALKSLLDSQENWAEILLPYVQTQFTVAEIEIQ